MADEPVKMRRGVGRVAFLARLEEFRKLVDAGWPITSIYEDHGPSTGLSYSQFVRYIGKYLRTPPTRNRSDEQPDSQPVCLPGHLKRRLSRLQPVMSPI